MTDDLRWMQVALTLGRRGLGRVWPNPAVGCVLIAPNGHVVGRGWTQPSGRPHAEVVALTQAGPRARGATAYVTLEPCAHTGQTGPCADALSAAGVARVVTALEDPDPRTAGAGHARLRGAGIDVTEGILTAQARDDHLGFLNRVILGRPLVTLKLAMTLDGKIATASGESQWITGPEARRAGHALRAQHDAVLVGAGTMRADDPTLTVRGLGVAHQPVRIVASRELDVPFPSRLSETCTPEAPVWLCHGPSAPSERIGQARARGLTCLSVPETANTLDILGLLRLLAEQGLTRVYCEGGGALAASLLSAGCVDRLVGVGAGCVIGADGLPGVGDLDLRALSDAPRFTRLASRTVGEDVLTEWAAVR